LLINDHLERLEAALLVDLYCESTELRSEKTMCSNIYIYILYSRREYVREWDREEKKDNPQL